MRSLDFTSSRYPSAVLAGILALILAVMNYMGIRTGDKRIYDVGHTVLPRAPAFVNDLQSAIIFIILLYNLPGWSSSKYTSYLTFMCVMFFFRLLTIHVTVLPSPVDSDECKPSLFGKCNDYIFSGHTTFNILTSYFIGAPVWPVVPIITSVGTISSRTHYSVDVLLAWLLFLALKCNMPSAI